eukprot:CAMPEP_0172304254 /NCGR_PEP_ID=MMETSP1058-20130122/5679_1 /TAXON_ID=83371 /ORGANISM="Detonula confervacea, Strain CCMP 353" /LENGTH=187 /DNA_ID=CAMNT_0013015399 /DNA_START=523 /DNA_END=1086 /DNA_ORIENTATION=+
MTIKVEKCEADAKETVSDHIIICLDVVSSKNWYPGGTHEMEGLWNLQFLATTCPQQGSEIDPHEEVVIDVHAEYACTMFTDLTGCGRLFGRMSDDSQGKTRMKFEVPRRGLLEFGLEIAMAKCGTSGYEINRARVGASLLVVVGLDDLILHPDMAQYEDAMVSCALDNEWFNITICQRLISLKDASP